MRAKTKSRRCCVGAGVAVCAGLLLVAGSGFAAEDELPGHQHAELPVKQSATISAAVDAAFTQYPFVVELQARSDQADAWAGRGQSWFADRPSLMLRYQTDRWGPDNGLDEYEAGLLLPLWNWGGRDAVQKFGVTLTAESHAAQQLFRWRVAGLLRRALWDVALAENDHELAAQALATAERLSASVERRHELGDIARSDVLLAQSTRLEAQTALIDATAGVLDAERAYRSTTGLEWRPGFTGETLSQQRDVDTNHPLLAFANAEVSRSEAALAVAEKTARSGTSLLIGPRRERPAFGSDLDSSMGITVSIPFGGSSHRQTEITAAARVLASARASRNQQLRQLNLALHEAAHGLNVVRENLATAVERLQLAERHQAMWESAYEKGELDLIDLLKTQATANTARRQVSRLKIDEKRQTALYNQAVGKTP